MGDLERATGSGSDGDGFIDGFHEPVVFVAHVGGVGQAALGEWPAERDELLAAGESARCVLETRRSATRPVGQRLANQGHHLLQLGGGCRAIVRADHYTAHRSESDHRGDVHRRAERIDRGEHRRHRLRAIVAPRRGARPAILAGDNGSDPLPYD